MPIRKFLPHILGALIFLGGAFIYVGGIPTASAVSPTTDTGYQYLAPLPKVGGASGETVDTNMAAYLSNMLKLIVALGGVLSVFVGIVGGIQYVASGITPSAKNDAKNRIQNALTGLVLVLSSYLILNSINPKLVAISFELKNVAMTSATVLTTTPSSAPCADGTSDCTCTNDSKCNTAAGYTCDFAMIGDESTGSETCILSETTTSSQCAATFNYTNYPSGSTWPSDTYERNILSGYGIFISSNDGTGNNCAKVGDSGCTSVCGLTSTAMSDLKTLKNSCDDYCADATNGCTGSLCSVTVTGATEFWSHLSHNDGNKVDLRYADTDNLTKYIKNTTYNDPLGNHIYINPTGVSTACGVGTAPHYTVGSLGTFVYETNHWHACL